MNIGNGITKIQRALDDESNYDDIQLQGLYWAIETVKGSPLSDQGLRYTRMGYTVIDFAVGAKSVKIKMSELYEETVRIVCKPEKFMMMGGNFKYLELHEFTHKVNVRVDILTIFGLTDAGAEAGGVMFDGMQLKDDFGETLKSYPPPKGE